MVSISGESGDGEDGGRAGVHGGERQVCSMQKAAAWRPG